MIRSAGVVASREGGPRSPELQTQMSRLGSRESFVSEPGKSKARCMVIGTQLLPAPTVKHIIDECQGFVLLRDFERVPDHAGVGVVSRDESGKRVILIARESITG